MKNSSYPQAFVTVNALVPAAILIYDVYTENAGADPANHAIHVTGYMAIICLGLSLCVTPARKLTGIAWLFYLRRTFGVLSFFYSIMHVAIFVKYNHGLDIPETLTDIFTTQYLAWGFFALIILCALGLTSFKNSPRLLGNKNWQWLHRTVYLGAVLSVLHYWMQGKQTSLNNAPPLKWAFAAAFAILLIYRMVAPFIPAPARPKPVRQPA